MWSPTKPIHFFEHDTKLPQTPWSGPEGVNRILCNLRCTPAHIWYKISRSRYLRLEQRLMPNKLRSTCLGLDNCVNAIRPMQILSTECTKSDLMSECDLPFQTPQLAPNYLLANFALAELACEHLWLGYIVVSTWQSTHCKLNFTKFHNIENVSIVMTSL